METALAAILSRVLHDVLPGIVRILDMVVNTVRAMMDFGGGFLRKLLGQDEMFMTPKQVAQKKKKEATAEASTAFSTPGAVDLANKAYDDPNSSESQAHMEKAGLPPLALAHPAFLDGLQARTTEIAERKEQRKRNKEMRMMMVPGYGRDAPTDDSPVAMSTSSRATPSTQVPKVEGKFETSMQDDVLLSRLAKLRDKIHEYRTKTTKVSLNVGMNNIAEATV